jgi:hypothetical protein
MKKLIIEVCMENDEMLRYSQARAVVSEALRGRTKPEVGDGSTMRDINGNRVGSWSVIDTDKRDADIAELLWDSLKRDPEHKDRRATGWGTKTLVGLVASVRRACGVNDGQ